METMFVYITPKRCISQFLEGGCPNFGGWLPKIWGVVAQILGGWLPKFLRVVAQFFEGGCPKYFPPVSLGVILGVTMIFKSRCFMSTKSIFRDFWQSFLATVWATIWATLGQAFGQPPSKIWATIWATTFKKLGNHPLATIITDWNAEKTSENGSLLLPLNVNRMFDF